MLSKDDLRKLIQEQKSYDFTHLHFEIEKTKRISALCAALTAVAHCEQVNSDGTNPRSEVLYRLIEVCGTNYMPMESLA